jgi:hypothetical protein
MSIRFRAQQSLTEFTALPMVHSFQLSYNFLLFFRTATHRWQLFLMGGHSVKPMPLGWTLLRTELAPVV